MTSPKRQLVNHKEAATVERQPTKPCSDCPWARDALPSWLGALTRHDSFKLPRDTERVFASPQQFKDHHNDD